MQGSRRADEQRHRESRQGGAARRPPGEERISAAGRNAGEKRGWVEGRRGASGWMGGRGMDESKRIKGTKVISYRAIYSNRYVPLNFDRSLTDVALNGT